MTSHETELAFIEKLPLCLNLPPKTRIFAAESQAIHKAISQATTLVSEEILIISDSLSALRVLENPYNKNEIVQAIQEKLDLYGFPRTLALLATNFLIKQPTKQ